MFNRQSTHIALLLWGGIFCLVATVCIFMSKNFDKEKRKWMFFMQGSTALLLCADALAWAFQRYPGTLGYYMVRITNFIVFAESDIVLLFFHQYVCASLFSEEERRKSVRARLVTLICILGVALVVISQFTNLYYYFDENNLYHRTNTYVISMIVPVSGMLLDFSVLMQKRKKVSRQLFVSMLSYIVLPLLAASIQLVVYGYSLINIAICISMILMFITVTVEQNQEMNQLMKQQMQTEEQLEISTTLNRCVKELSADTDIHEAIYNLLEIIDHYFDGDRSYIFEIKQGGKTITNTHEYVKNGVSRQMDNLQEVPIEVVGSWMEKFQKDQVYYISDLNQEKGKDSYEILREQDIQSLLAVPLRRRGKIIGFLGVDNPRKHNDDATLLSSIQYFITNSLSIKKQQEQLQYLSYRDMLTQLYNRNKYISVVASYDDEPVESTGVAYIDLNGLKKVNDEQGHDAGDSLIARAGQEIFQLFPENAFRIGGDEFVIILTEVNEAVFARKLKELQEGMQRQEISISIGSVWKESAQHLRDMLTEADQRMYEEKERYHKVNQDYRR